MNWFIRLFGKDVTPTTLVDQAWRALIAESFAYTTLRGRSVRVIQSNFLMWFVSRGGKQRAFTLDHTIITHKGAELLYGTLVHELVHVYQYEKYGVIGFLWRYFVRGERKELEAEAYAIGNKYH